MSRPVSVQRDPRRIARPPRATAEGGGEGQIRRTRRTMAVAGIDAFCRARFPLPLSLT